ncbi:hypothetical protein [uncultured Dialister sp.]|jgi:hypothetical protein|uniref:hypothetical protein n=1 Tax=uncultured Dialister sp. TaxID=278064 RepID=UPI00206E5F1A|nr:hypothetical protein [uncultured Dialister sp.]DAI59981.1 MAG TPA: hypothetical protein [Caudoviricetes sp.]
MARKRETAPVKRGPVIYVGPGFRDVALNTYSIFADGIPERYKGTVYEALFVFPEQLEAAKAQLTKKGSMMRVFYDKAVREHNSKGE